MVCGDVVEGNLFAGSNVRQSEKQNVPVENSDVAVWLARVINVVRAVTTNAAIKAPPQINGTNAQDSVFSSSYSAYHFTSRYLLASVLSDFTSSWKGDRRKTAFAADR